MKAPSWHREAVQQPWDVTGTFLIWTTVILLCWSGSRLRQQSYGHTRLCTRVCYRRLDPARGTQTLGFNTDQTCPAFDAKAPFQGPSVQRRRFDQLLGATRLLLGAELELQLELISKKARNFSAPSRATYGWR